MKRGPAIVGVVLAGGQGRRLGGANKALLPFGGTTLGHWCLARLAAQVGLVAINANRDLGELERFGFALAPDQTNANAGPLDGILAAMAFAAGRGFTHVVTVPVDTPFFPDDLADRLGAGTTQAPCFAQAHGRAHGALALWPVGLAGPLRRFILDGATLKLQAFLAATSARAVGFDDAPPHAFLNINTPDDLAEAQALLRAGAGGPRSGG